MSEKAFVDTNLLVYAVDKRAGEKHRTARRALERLRTENRAVVSTQVLQEFYVAATRQVKLAPLDVKAMLSGLSALEVVLVDVECIDDAIDCSVLNRISFWDALIVSAARKAACGTLWTEDLNDGQIIQGLRIENPFRLRTERSQ